MQVRIYQPAKTAMQSGRANTRRWLLEFEPTVAKRRDPLMGWVASADATSHVRLRFASKEEAIAHAEKNGWTYTVMEPHCPKVQIRSYADNFRFDRVR